MNILNPELLVTIGLPVYNGADYLDLALKSLSEQTMQGIQFLISDNASTDATPEILAKWAAKDPQRFRYHRQPQNIGAYPNFKWVVANAESRWFAFAAHDDLWSPDYAKALYSAITAKPHLVLAVPQLITMFEDGREDRRRPVPDYIFTGSRVDSIRGALNEATAGWFYGLWDRGALLSAIENTKHFTHAWGSDFVVLLPAILSGALVSSNQAIYYKRQTPLSEQRHRPKTGKEHYHIYCDFLQECFSALNASSLSPFEKVRLVPPLISYARHGTKPRRILRAVAREIVHILRSMTRGRQ